ncbi:glutamine ABC transporter permease protein [Kingella kingae]|nr:hypothetical protein [Kingella kingae]QIP46675.1 hypothetical protein HBA47_00945 [Kingella kingae]STR01579.1 glutamine ABC transporter permease protein [Kingella kingae]
MNFEDWLAQHSQLKIIWEYREMFVKGAWMTLKLTTWAVAGGVVLGLFGALARIVRVEKGGAFAKAIAVAELAYVQSTISGRYSIYEAPLYTVALIYLVMSIVLGWVFSSLEKKYNTAHHR